MIVSGDANWLSFTGLIFDIVGVVILGWALITPRIRMIYNQSGSYWGGNKTSFQALRTQRFDSWFGVGTMLMGFVGQAVASVGVTISKPISLVLIILGLPILIGVWFFWRRYYIRQSDQIHDKLRAAKKKIDQ